MRSAKEWLAELVRFPSLSTQEHALADWLQEEVGKLGLLEVARYENNLVFSYGQGVPWLWLNTHLDVVPPAEGQLVPFEPRVLDGWMHGRGTVDAKGSGAAMLAALLSLAAERVILPGRVSFVYTVCEEAHSDQNGVRLLRGVLPTPDAAIVGEPTSLAPCIAQRGLLVLRLVLQGQAGHAARTPPEGNVLFRLPAVLEALRGMAHPAENPMLGKLKITPTVLKAGAVNNVVPGEVHLHLDLRTLPETPTPELLPWLEARLPQGVAIEVISDRFPAVATPAEATIAQAALAATQKPFFGSPTCSDWVFLKEVPTVKLGPGESTRSHTAQECIRLEELEQAVAVYKHTIQSYFASI